MRYPGGAVGSAPSVSSATLPTAVNQYKECFTSSIVKYHVVGNCFIVAWVVCFHNSQYSHTGHTGDIRDSLPFPGSFDSSSCFFKPISYLHCYSASSLIQSFPKWFGYTVAHWCFTLQQGT